jgi:hypothetical protein
MKRRFTTVMLTLAVWVSAVSHSDLRSTEPTTQWVTKRQVGRFYIFSDFELPTNEPLLEELGDIEGQVSRLLAIPTAGQPIHVVLFSSSKEYSRYIKNYFPTVPERRALFIQQRGPGMLFAHWHADVRTDIRHEVVHGLLNDRSSPLPIWLDEGLAEYFEVPEASRMSGNPHLAQVIEGLDRDYVPSLTELEQLGSIEQLGTNQYRDSWAWAHFLLHRKPQTRQHLVQELAMHRKNQDTLPLSRIIAIELPNWRAEFADHFRSLAKNKSIAN